MPDGKLIIDPVGGICNRVRTILSGIALNRLLNKKLEVIWDTGSDLNCPYNLLFEKSDYFEIIDRKESGYPILSSYNNNILKRLVIKVINKYHGLDLTIEEHDLPKTFYRANYNPTELAHKKNVYIRTCIAFFPCNDWHLFTPLPELRQRISANTATFSPSTVGVHIRRGDHSASIEKSPLALFEDAMKNELAKNTDANFYLATDNIAVQERLLTIFGNRIMMLQNKDFSRDTRKGIHDGLVDLYSLSRTNKIIGSYDSSFSETAAAMHNIPLVTVNKDKA